MPLDYLALAREALASASGAVGHAQLPFGRDFWRFRVSSLDRAVKAYARAARDSARAAGRSFEVAAQLEAVGPGQLLAVRHLDAAIFPVKADTQTSGAGLFRLLQAAMGRRPCAAAPHGRAEEPEEAGARGLRLRRDGEDGGVELARAEELGRSHRRELGRHLERAAGGARGVAGGARVEAHGSIERRDAEPPEVAPEGEPRVADRARRLGQRLAGEGEVVERHEVIAVLARELLREGALTVRADPRAEEALRDGRVGAVEAHAREPGLERARDGLLDARAMAGRGEAGAELARRSGRRSVGGPARLLRGPRVPRSDVRQREPHHRSGQRLVEPR
ncbi:MAG TPA: hypothetical protein VF805_02695, partial [Anaeromyxobacteraceae bacterium]